MGRCKRNHGMYQSRVYQIWQHMKGRSLNPNNKAYPQYGGRGIKVCDRWLTFQNFYADMGEPPAGFTLERKNNNDGYYPENCVWGSRKTQANNRRNNHLITFNGVTLTGMQWVRATNLKRSTLFNRLKNPKWTIEQALTTPSVRTKTGGLNHGAL